MKSCGNGGPNMRDISPYPMRRSDRALSEEEARAILDKGQFGFLATVGPDGLPYGVPLSYVVLQNCIYFHCAQQGRKIDNLQHCPMCSFTVVGEVQSAYDNGFTTWFESAMAFGRIRSVENTQEKERILRALAAKYLPGHMEHADHDIARSFNVTAVYGMEIDFVSGKAKKKKN